MFRSLSSAQPRSLAPWLAWSIISGFIAITEFGLMLFFSWALPEHVSALTEALVDSVLLTLLVAPVLWLVVVRPLRQAAQQRDQFLADLFSTIEDERRRISRELHDGVGQSMTLLVSGLRSLSEIRDPAELQRRNRTLLELAQRALKDTKQLSLGLRPSLLDDLGLPAAIERVLSEVREQHQIEVAFQTDQTTRLPERIESGLFRITQEAVSNVVRHAQARNLSVSLSTIAGVTCLKVEDDGCGIDMTRASRANRRSGHLGLIGMNERAVLLGGEFLLQSEPGRGTRVIVKVPEQN